MSFQGIYVTRVSEGGPAEIAGLQIGDKIMQVTDVPKEENKAWPEGLKPSGVGGLPRLTKADLELMLALPPEEAGSLLCVPPLWCVASHNLGTSAWGPAWVTQAPQSLTCF